MIFAVCLVTVAFVPVVAAEPASSDVNGNLTVILDDGTIIKDIPDTILAGVPEEKWTDTITRYIKEHPYEIGGAAVVVAFIIGGVLHFIFRDNPVKLTKKEYWIAEVASDGDQVNWDILINRLVAKINLDVLINKKGKRYWASSGDYSYTHPATQSTDSRLTQESVATYLAGKQLFPQIAISQPWTRPQDNVTCDIIYGGLSDLPIKDEKKRCTIGYTPKAYIKCTVEETIQNTRQKFEEYQYKDLDQLMRLCRDPDCSDTGLSVNIHDLPYHRTIIRHTVTYGGPTSKNDQKISLFIRDQIKEVPQCVKDADSNHRISLDEKWDVFKFNQPNSGMSFVKDSSEKMQGDSLSPKRQIPAYPVDDPTRDALLDAQKTGETALVIEGTVGELAAITAAAETVKVGGAMIAGGGPPGWVIGGVIVAASGVTIAWIWVKPEDMPAGPGGMTVLAAGKDIAVPQLTQEDLKMIVDKVKAGDYEIAVNTSEVSYVVDKDGTGGYQVVGIGKVTESQGFWKIVPVDTVGSYPETSPGTSLVLDKDGQPHIAYYSAKTGSIMYASRSGDTWLTEVVGPSAGTYSTSLAFDDKNNPVITYGDGVHFGNLMVAKKTGSAWNVAVVARGTAGDAGEGSSLALDQEGILHIAYTDGQHLASLYYATLNPRSGEWEFSLVDDGGVGGDTGYNPSLKIDATGQPHISYRDGKHWPNLMYAASSDGGKTWTKTKVDNGGKTTGQTGWGQSLALDSQGFPHIVYYNQTGHALQYASWDGATWSTEILYPGYYAAYSSVTMDSQDLPHISFYDMTSHRLCYVTLSQDQTKWMIHVVDDYGEAGAASSIVLSKNDNPSIAYYDNMTQQLDFAQWVP